MDGVQRKNPRTDGCGSIASRVEVWHPLWTHRTAVALAVGRWRLPFPGRVFIPQKFNSKRPLKCTGPQEERIVFKKHHLSTWKFRLRSTSPKVSYLEVNQHAKRKSSISIGDHTGRTGDVTSKWADLPESCMIMWGCFQICWKKTTPQKSNIEPKKYPLGNEETFTNSPILGCVAISFQGMYLQIPRLTGAHLPGRFFGHTWISWHISAQLKFPFFSRHHPVIFSDDNLQVSFIKFRFHESILRRWARIP